MSKKYFVEIKRYNSGMSSEKPDLNNLKDTIQDSNINFLLGSGLSMPHLRTLGNIEVLLTEVEKDNTLSDQKKRIVRASLYKQYCDDVIFKNLEILDGTGGSEEVLNTYKRFLQTINSILLNRKISILSKQVNIYTTNIDVYLEKALDDVGLEYNDGFSGRLSPIFSLSNFRKSSFKKSLHFDNTSEIPVFNLLKLHGSLTWEVKGSDDNADIYFSPNLGLVRELKAADYSDIQAAGTPERLSDLVATLTRRRLSDTIKEFEKKYVQLPIVNPTKDKFRLTLLNRNYYELLRMYANCLEKENSVLFVMGFSFADEHIREVTIRAADSNPTLLIYIFAHSSKSRVALEEYLKLDKLKNKNIRIIAPDVLMGDETQDEFNYDLSTINSGIFEKILSAVSDKTP